MKINTDEKLVFFFYYFAKNFLIIYRDRDIYKGLVILEVDFSYENQPIILTFQFSHSLY